MNIIDKIEISYFRSLYKVNINDVNDLNILSGSNDVGKSNVLKALNLFFEGFTDWGNQIDFESDINRKRLEEVKSESIKGKQIIWIAVTFDIPQDSYSGSLPETVRVKKKWDRYNNERTENNLDTKEKHGELPSSRSVAKRFLSHFLNKIDFEYIPAVRDEEFRVHLLRRLQNYILEEEGEEELSATVDDLASHVESNIQKLNEDFDRVTGINSTISPPNDITSLFQSFDVSTAIKGDHVVPLEQRGDGIQSQYLLSVLRHMCSDDSNYHIWAFEEPENSLEYSRVKRLGDELRNDCSMSQIFATSHSPALIGLDNSKCNVFRTYTGDSPYTSVSLMESSNSNNSLHADIGLHKLKSDLYEDYKRNLQKVEKLESIRNGKLLTEGKTDAKIISTAFTKLYDGKPPYEVKAADPGSGGGASNLAKFSEATMPSDDYKTVSVFDRDKEGKQEFKNLSSNFSSWKDRNDVKVHDNGVSYALLLPVPSFRNENEEMCIEKMFEDDTLQIENEEGKGLSMENVSLEGIKLDNGEFIRPENINDNLEEALDIINSEVGSQDEYSFRIKGGKGIFAYDIVPRLNSSNFRSFKKLFRILDRIIKQ